MKHFPQWDLLSNNVNLPAAVAKCNSLKLVKIFGYNLSWYFYKSGLPRSSKIVMFFKIVKYIPTLSIRDVIATASVK